MGWRFILSLAFAVIIALFAIANAGSVKVNFIVAVYEVSQAIVILVSAIAGALVATLLSLVKRVQQNYKINNQSKKITELEHDKEALSKKYAELEAHVKKPAPKESPEASEAPDLKDNEPTTAESAEKPL